jgi:hypothetical protein
MQETSEGFTSVPFLQDDGYCTPKIIDVQVLRRASSAPRVILVTEPGQPNIILDTECRESQLAQARRYGITLCVSHLL